MKFPINALVEYDGLEAEVIAHTRGWYTVRDVDGREFKARAKNLTEATERPQEGDERSLKVQMREARQRYERTTNYAGERSMDSGDDVACLLRGLEPIEACMLADRVLDVEDGHHMRRYGHLNPGQQRMNAGNRIRAAVRKETVSIKEVEDCYKVLNLRAHGQNEIGAAETGN